VAALPHEHERADGSQFEALYEGRLAPSVAAEQEWRSANSKPRSLDEIDDLISASVGTGDGTPVLSPAVTSSPATRHRTRIAAVADAPQPRVLIGSIWQRAWKDPTKLSD
jgi:hypothetical protein